MWKSKKIKIIRKRKNNEIEKLKEIKNKENDGETKISKLLTDLEYKKHDTLHVTTILESKLIKLEITPI